MTMKTTGDRILDRTPGPGGRKGPVRQGAGPGPAGRADATLSVHSLQGSAHGVACGAAHAGLFPAGGSPGCAGSAGRARRSGTGPSPWAAPASGGSCSCSGCIRRSSFASSGATCRPGLRKLDEGRYGATDSGGGGAEAAGAGGSDHPVFLPGGDDSCGRPGHSGGAGPGRGGLRLLTWSFLTPAAGGLRPGRAGLCPGPGRRLLQPPWRPMPELRGRDPGAHGGFTTREDWTDTIGGRQAQGTGRRRRGLGASWRKTPGTEHGGR